MERLDLNIGEKILYKNKDAIIIKIVDLNQVCIEEVNTNIIHTVGISEIAPYNISQKPIDNEIHLLSEAEWVIAKHRYEIIKPILKNRKDFSLINQIAETNEIHYSTIYRWVKKFDQTNLISSLTPSQRKGGKGKSRILKEIDQIINKVISDEYLNSSKKSINRVIRKVNTICKLDGINSPHPNTIRNRIKNIKEEELIISRYGKSKARDKFNPILGHFPGADYPLSVVQIDHTKVDIILVDEQYRKPFLRPWITVAIDVYSRMVLGFYLSFDPPGELGTGLCIANSILPKESWLQRFDIDGEWSCWGLMNTIHLDNAKEFKGKMLRRACDNYGINIEFRPVKTPHYGGHIERILGTFSKEIHDLPGTTFSNHNDRENYKSEEHAALTINEFEKWLLTYILNVYHKRIHSSLNMSPLQKFKEGVLGSENHKGIGMAPRIYNEKRLKLDFMPFFERTIQEYGIVIDHIFYYDEVLRKYIHAKDPSNNHFKRKFIFKRDPRDISIVYFFDPELNEYFEIPYRDTSKPPISIWEFNDVIRKLARDRVEIDEDSIFNAYRNMEEIEMQAIRNTKKLKRQSKHKGAKNHNVHKIDDSKPVLDTDIKTETEVIIEPFDDIEDETFT